MEFLTFNHLSPVLTVKRHTYGLLTADTLMQEKKRDRPVAKDLSHRRSLLAVDVLHSLARSQARLD